MRTVSIVRTVAARRWLWRWLLAMVALADFSLAGSAWAQAQKQVFVLHSTRRDGQIAVLGDRELPRILEAGLGGRLDYYSEFIDRSRFHETEYHNALRAFLGTKYRDKRFDLIVALGDLPLEFVDENRSNTSVPIVFFSDRASPRRVPNATGVVAELDLHSTIDLALELQPDLQQVFVVVGTSPSNRIYEDAARVQLRRFESRLAITYLSGMPTKDLETRLASLPKHSIVYYLIVDRDGENEYFHPLEYLDRIRAVANAPMYSWVDSTMGRGVVGGSLKSQQAEIEAVGALALRVLKGQRADSILPSSRDLNVWQVDWRQLRRWGISEARVPSGTRVLFRELSTFEQYRNYILGILGVVGLQTALIAGLVIQRRRRRRAEQSLRESEQHFRLTADTAPVMIWRSGPDKHCDFFNRPWLVFRGRTLQQEVGDGWTEGVHPDDLDRCLSTYVAAFDRRDAYRIEYRLRRADGQYRWVLASGVPRHMPDGRFAGYIGSCIDITERRQGEEALRTNEAKLRASHAQIQDLAGRLITAQEAERSRIARELHDDVSQQLAVLTMELELLRRAKPDQITRLAGEALKRTHDIAKTMHDLSHRLHPARLSLLSLVDSLDALRDELSQYEIPIAFTYENVPSTLSPDLRLCLFRVVQEGLQNAIKHSRAHAASVHVRGDSGTLTLTIADDGVGFDVDAAWRKGLGLISMSERLEAMGGSLQIRSGNGAGTRLEVTVPLEIGQTVEVAAH